MQESGGAVAVVTAEAEAAVAFDAVTRSHWGLAVTCVIGLLVSAHVPLMKQLFTESGSKVYTNAIRAYLLAKVC